MDRLKKAIEEAGGVAAVAKAAKLTEGHIYNVLRGDRPLARTTARRLQAVVVLPARVWGALVLGTAATAAEAAA